jgi:hypothetical protein
MKRVRGAARTLLDIDGGFASLCYLSARADRCNQVAGAELVFYERDCILEMVPVLREQPNADKRHFKGQQRHSERTNNRPPQELLESLLARQGWRSRNSIWVKVSAEAKKHLRAPQHFERLPDDHHRKNTAAHDVPV